MDMSNHGGDSNVVEERAINVKHVDFTKTYQLFKKHNIIQIQEPYKIIKGFKAGSQQVLATSVVNQQI